MRPLTTPPTLYIVGVCANEPHLIHKLSTKIPLAFLSPPLYLVPHPQKPPIYCISAGFCAASLLAQYSIQRGPTQNHGEKPMQTNIPSQGGVAASPRPGAPAHDELPATAPGQLRVIKRNGAVVVYDESKIVIALTKAYLAVEGGPAAASARVRETIAKMAAQITTIFNRRMPSGGAIHIEEIQDQVELALMRTGEHKVARAYVLYRAERSRQRDQQRAQEQPKESAITITHPDGTQGPLDTHRLRTVIDEACAGLEGVSADLIYEETLKNLYPGVKLEDVRTSAVMTARTLVEQDPNYSYVTARLLLDTLRSEALSFLGITDSATQSEMNYRYAGVLRPYIEKGVELGLL